jgi:putative N6-adenine-specific DNA methylase
MTASTYEFFLIYPITLVDLGKKELESKFKDTSYQELTLHKGGISLVGTLDFGMKLIHQLKIPSNILIRLQHFKARDLPKLYKKLTQFDWKPWLYTQFPRVKVSCKQSRLMHTKKIEKTFFDAISHRLKAQALPKKIIENPIEQTYYLKIDNDEVTLSLQLTVAPLYKRKPFIGQSSVAPLRENFAAAMYFLMTETTPDFDTVIDPMCGSGTILQEANTFGSDSQVISAIPTSYLRKQEKAEHQSIGMDVNNKIIQEHQKEDFGTFSIADAFTNKCINKNSIVITNPPYGERIKLDRPPKQYYTDLIKAIQNNIQPKAIGIIVPDKFRLSFDYKHRLPFNNNSQKVSFYII